jgi:signal transduction histidine kinase
VRCDVEPELPRVLGNQEALLLVCDNLIDNVLRHARSGRELAIQLAHRDASVVLTVSDRGAGISAEELPHVTQKFFRGKGTTASGTGLGLAIVSRTVKEFGGALRIESPSGTGTRVTVEFPAILPPPRSLADLEPRREDVSAAG